jgi:RecA/RadA recombinase
MSSATERKMETLLGLPVYIIHQGKDPATATMGLGRSYNLLINVDIPPEEWKIEFNDGIQNLVFDMGGNGVPQIFKSAAEELIKDYKMALLDLAMDEGPVEDKEPAPEKKNLSEKSDFDLGPAKREIPAAPKEKVKARADTPKAPKAPKASGLLDMISSYVGNDVLEIFGDTGSGKSKFVLEVAREALVTGKKVFYLDTERNLTKTDVEGLKGCQYRYTPVMDEIDSIAQNLPKVDVVIIDSIGFPILTTFARMSVKQKGDALLKLIAIFGDLKTWAYKNNGVVIVTNQPESDFNKDKGHVIRPFGDKSQFAAKEIWKTEFVSRRPDCTKTRINAFRSRSVGHGTRIADMEINSEGVEVI